jgi:hypothetical protein
MRVGAPALSAALLRGHDLAGFVIGLDDAAAEPEVSARMSLGSSDQARAHLNPEAGSLGLFRQAMKFIATSLVGLCSM